MLQPNTDYIACVVPTFELGRRAGLGEEIKDTELTATDALKPAWSFTPAPPTSVRLPVYYHWRFRTGEGDDFESLVRLLRAVPAPDGLGKRPMDISEPGFGLPPTFPDGRAALARRRAARAREPRHSSRGRTTRRSRSRPNWRRSSTRRAKRRSSIRILIRCLRRRCMGSGMRRARQSRAKRRRGSMN